MKQRLASHLMELAKEEKSKQTESGVARDKDSTGVGVIGATVGVGREMHMYENGIGEWWVGEAM